MGSSLSCLCARPEKKGAESQRCAQYSDCSDPPSYAEVHSDSCKRDYISCSHGKAGDGDWAVETAVLAECSPARWTELRAAQLDWHRSHAPQDLYAQASAEAFASSMQALQTFARLSGRASQAGEAAALSLIRGPGAPPPACPENSSPPQERVKPAGQQAALASPPMQPLTQLCHELPISQIMQGSLHLPNSQELRVDRLDLSLEPSEQQRCCGSSSSIERSQHGSEWACCSRAERAQPGAESCRDRPRCGAGRSAPDAGVRLGACSLEKSSLGAQSCCPPQKQCCPQPQCCLQPGPTQDTSDAGKVCKAMSSPFCQPPPRRSLSFGNMSTQAPSHSLAGSSISATEMRAPAPASSPFLRDQQGLGGVNTPFGAWQCMMGGQPQEEPATADQREERPQPGPSLSPFFCSEPPLRSGSEPVSWKDFPPRRPASLQTPNPTCCPPSLGVSDIANLHKEVHLEPLMQLVCTVLQCEVAMLTLLDGSQIVVMRNGKMESRAETDASGLPGLWPQLPITDSCDTVVVSDVDADRRMPAGFREKLGFGFFCAKPLCSAVCRRVGTLSIACREPREFSAGPIGILNNLSELMVHEIEAACERAAQRAQSEKLLAAMDLYQDAFMLVDTTVRKWRILHLNLMAANEIGVQREEAKDAIFWDLFEVRNPHTGELAEPWVPCEAAAIKGQKFVLHKVRLSAAQGNRLLTMRFRPACQELQSNAYSCGLPLPQPGRPFYFVEVSEVPMPPKSSPLSALPPRSMYTRTSQIASPRVQTPRGVCPPLDMQSGPSQSSMLMGSPVSPLGMPDAIPFQGLELGYVLGRGAFGSVFQGTYNGKPVAVKIIVDNDQARVKDGLPVEAHITAGLNHRNVVRTIAHAWRPLVSHMSASMSVWDSAGSNAVGPFASNEGETWLLLELCDRGTLQEAILSGYFKQGAPTGKQAPKQLTEAPAAEAENALAVRMDAVLATAAEVAAGMLYLHARSIVHGDLTGANVLLQECMESQHGITAKVADFGLSREMQSTSRIETRTCGTITHMPPELLSEDVVSKAADVYAFGVLLWELYHGVGAWDGLNHAQVIHAVAIMNSCLEFCPGTPAPYQKLSRTCMSVDPDARPTFEQVAAELQSLQAEFAA